MTTVGKEASSSKSDVLVDRLDAAVSSLDEELRMEKALNTENNTVLATQTDGNAVTRQRCTRQQRPTRQLPQPCWRTRPGTDGRRESM